MHPVPLSEAFGLINALVLAEKGNGVILGQVNSLSFFATKATSIKKMKKSDKMADHHSYFMSSLYYWGLHGLLDLSVRRARIRSRGLHPE